MSNTTCQNPPEEAITPSVEVTLASLPTRNSRIASPILPSESFGRRFAGFFRECWRSMRVMKVNFESAEHLPT